MAVMNVLDREHTVAPHSYNRWLIPPAALAIHLCIGQVYATSVYKNSLVKHFEASQTAVGFVFSIAIVILGLSAAVFGTWVDRVGPRRAMFTAAAFWSSGFLVGGAGIYTSQLWLLYLGYGVLGGVGLGIGYISPVSTLMKWFPDRPGLATGMAIMGFGGGAMVAAPASRQLMAFFDSDYSPGDPGSVASGGAVTGLFVGLGVLYFLIMMLGVANIRVPPPGWTPEGYSGDEDGEDTLGTDNDVSANTALRTPQFWLLWTVLFCNVTAGIGILEQAAPMIQDFFRNSTGGDSSVTVAAAGGFVGVLSLFNMAGRFVWSSTSDYIGRKPTYMIFLGAGIGLYVLLALAGSTATAVFVLVAALIISFYGGGFATVPAYLRDLFGVFQVGAIHGRLLTAWAAAGVAGPLIINAFLDRAGGAGTLTADAYRPALFTMVGILAVGFVANLLIRPVDRRHHADLTQHDAAEEKERQEGMEEKQESEPSSTRARLIGSWAVVTVLLAYGVVQTAITATRLFA